MKLFKKYFPTLLIILIFLVLACQKFDTSKLMEGDIIFQTSMSSQSEAIQIVTHSKYSHMGMLYKNGNELYVLEVCSTGKINPFK